MSLTPYAAADVGDWQPQPNDWKGATVADNRATLTADAWSFLVASDTIANGELSAQVTIREPAKRFNFFGGGWSAWPDPKFGDGGFEAGLLLRSGTASIPFDGRTLAKDFGYRVQISHKYQLVALVKFPDGGYVRVVPCPVKLATPHRLHASVVGNEVTIRVDDVERIRFRDDFLPIASGQFGIGVSSSAKVEFNDVALKPLAPTKPTTETIKHAPKFSVRKFLGDRQWIFDGDEPILQLHSEGDPSCFAKLRPGYKPQLTFDSHWGLENQGAFPDAKSKWTAPDVTGGGESIQAKWSARSVKDRFVTRSTMTVGFDARRGMYTYAIDSELEVLPGEPFHFRYGFDFEHHTPLDPFGWQYLIAKRKGGTLYHRPVTPVDPGPQNDLEGYHGLRVWHGRHVDSHQVSPAVEYEMEPEWNETTREGKKFSRKLNTAVCAAFYDTGISIEPETTPPGSKVRVKYRYTGYPASETRELFEQSRIYDAPTLDPNHHYIFADEWPRLTFSKFVPLSESWIYGRTPFMTGHNQRPTYDLVKNCGAGSGFAMRLGPASFAKANLPVGTSLNPGRWMMTALVKAENVHGPGGCIELEATQPKTGKPLMAAKHFAGNGTFDWRKQGFVFDVPAGAGGLSISFGNSGTGNMLVTDVEFSPLKGDAPAGVLARPNNRPGEVPATLAGAVADYRMLEGQGHFVLNHAAGSPLGHLNLANLAWDTDQGRPALRFAENTTGKKDYRVDTVLGRNYFGHAGYDGKQTLPIALSGHHGGGDKLPGVTLAAWIKPAAEMGKSTHGGKGDILGYGGRRFILSLHNQKAPYKLAARINVNDSVVADAQIDADRWHHAALTCEPADGQWKVRLYLDGKKIAEGTTKKFPSDSIVPPSLILGAEIFYFHDAYYRGLIGRTLVCHRAMSEQEIAELAK